LASLFSIIIHPMEMGLIWLSLAVGHAGIAIILFTILVRAVLSPLQIVQLRNAKAMQRVQPLIKELQKKHGKDRQKLTEETMALYKEHKVNPAMGCLPTLLQFPILIGLFYALMHLGSSPAGYPSHIDWAKAACNGHAVTGWASWFQTCYAVTGAAGTPAHVFDLFHANFLWLSHGLGKPDPLYILPLLAGITQWIQSRMMLTQSSDPQQQMMNNMMNFMPLMIIFFAANYASGLSLYWVTSTVIGILIQYRITGWGLLASKESGGVLAGVRQLFQPAPGSVGSAAPRKPAPARAAPAKPVKQELNGTGPVDATADVVTNGQNGQGSETTRPRKKANRGRGGRGGRRG
jgi:YidC/Oxa1 family membrane protein insertase